MIKVRISGTNLEERENEILEQKVRISGSNQDDGEKERLWMNGLRQREMKKSHAKKKENRSTMKQIQFSSIVLERKVIEEI